MLGTVYFICFSAGLLLALLRGLLSMFGGDTNADFHPDTDVHIDADGESPGMGLLNLTVIGTFVSVFGGVGALMHFTAKSAPAVSLPVSLASAFAVAVLVGLLLRKIVTSTQAGSAPLSVAGFSAEVITPIPEKGLGEVAYVAKGSRYVAPAREKDGGAVGKNESVKIIEMSGGICLVERKG